MWPFDQVINATANLFGTEESVVIKYIMAVVAFALSVVIGKYLDKLVTRALLKTASVYVAKMAGKLFLYAAAVLGIVATISILGIDVSSLIIASGFLGIVIGLAAQSSLGEAIAGLFFTAEGHVRVGDLVELGDMIGYVIDIGFLSTKVRTLDGRIIRVPNSTLISSNVVNLSRIRARRYDIPVGISYLSDIGKAVEVIRDVLDRSEYVLAEPEPEIFVEELGESSVNLLVRAWIPIEYWWEVRKYLVKEIKEALDRNGIEIPFPQRVVWLRGTKGAQGEPDK